MEDEQVLQSLQSTDPAKSEDEQRFDALTERKKELWNVIASRVAHEDIYYGYAHEKTPEWKQIVELDRELLALDAKIKGGR